MAKSADHWEGRRALTDNSGTSVSSYQAAGLRLMELDQLCEAVDMFGRAGDDEGLMKIIDAAVEEGNYFLFQAAASRLKERQPDPARLRTLLETAQKNGKAMYAEKAKNYLES